jgi:hypothetical protein
MNPRAAEAGATPDDLVEYLNFYDQNDGFYLVELNGDFGCFTGIMSKSDLGILKQRLQGK